ncbi:MAG: MaoC family dehydratase [Janthinobacterium lividum]
MSHIVTIGESFSQTAKFSAGSIREFAMLVGDTNPLHHDAAYAQQRGFGSVIASGTQPASLFMALVANHFSAFAQPLALEFELKFHKPVRAGDTIIMTWTVTDAFWKASLGGDLTMLDGRVVNQIEQEVITAKAKTLVMPKSADASASQGLR